MSQLAEKNVLADLDTGVVKLTSSTGLVKELPLNLFSCYQRNLPLKKRAWVSRILSDVPGCDLKERYQAFTQSYNITPSKMQYLGERLWYKYIMTKFGEVLVKKLAFNNQGIAPNKVDKLEQHHEQLKSTLSDKQINMLPLVYSTGLTVKEIKDSVSKSVWKKLINNSFSRNKLIAGVLEYYSLRTKKSVDLLKSLTDLPSSILKTPSLVVKVIAAGDLSSWVVSTAKAHRCLTKVRDVSKLTDLVYDTHRMCNQRGMVFNINWGFKRMQETHTMLIREQLEAREAPNKVLEEQLNKSIEYTNLPLNSFTYLGGNVSIELLSSGNRVKQEGKEMHHCVGWYSGWCMDERYAVLSLTSTKGRSTIGLILEGDRFRVQQHYAACNNEPCDLHKEVDKFIVECLEK